MYETQHEALTAEELQAIRDRLAATFAALAAEWGDNEIPLF